MKKKFENFLWNFWKKLKSYIANISHKSCVFKWIFKKIILKIFYDMIFLEKNFKLRFLKIVPLKNLVFNWICSQIYYSLGPYWSYSLQMKKVLQSFQTYCGIEVYFCQQPEFGDSTDSSIIHSMHSATEWSICGT